MKKQTLAAIGVVMLVVLPFLSISCQGPKRVTVDAIGSTWELIQPRYVEYLENDESLPADHKVTRIRTAEMLTRLIQEAKESFNE